MWHSYTWLIVCVLSASALMLRTAAPARAADSDAERQYLQQLYVFLKQHGMAAPRLVHYTRDGGIRGLQFSFPRCNGNLQIVVMPEGDEFLGLWEGRSSQVGYQTQYLFQQRLHDEFPRLRFWIEASVHAMAQRLQIEGHSSPGPVYAIAFPHRCTEVGRLPWTTFQAHG